MCFLAFLLACAKEKPAAKNFPLAYAELRIAEREYGESQTGKIVRSKIMQKHGLSLETFEKELENAKKDSKNWMSFQKNVVAAMDSIITAQADETEQKNE